MRRCFEGWYLIHQISGRMSRAKLRDQGVHGGSTGYPALCTGRRRDIVEMAAPRVNHRGSDLRRTFQYVVRYETRGRPASGFARRGGAEGRLICATKCMPSLRSEREMRERREMQAVRRIFILSRFASFPACLAAGPACMLLRLCAFPEQTSLPCPPSRGWKPLPPSLRLTPWQVMEPRKPTQLGKLDLLHPVHRSSLCSLPYACPS